MATLYLDRARLLAEAHAGTIEVRRAGALLGRYPLAVVDHLVVLAQCHLDSRLIAALCANGSAVTVVNARRGTAAVLLEGRSVPARRRAAQAQLAMDASGRRGWAQRLLSAKLRRQVSTLATAAEVRPAERYSLNRAAERIRELRARLGECDGMAAMMGLEGAAAAAYFEAFARLFAPALGFERRNRRPPRDPVNACLSFAYTLAIAEASLEARRAGLDPLIGFLHDEAPGRPSLACDVVEPLRPALDWFVFECFRGGTLRAAHFGKSGPACLLGKAGRAAFLDRFGQYEERRRRTLRAQVRMIASALAPGEAGDRPCKPAEDPPDG